MALYYINDSWATEKDMKVSAFDVSVLRGFGVFDFLKVYNRKPFALKEHLDRLDDKKKRFWYFDPQDEKNSRKPGWNIPQKNVE